MPTSEARIEANRRNAALSTGPKTTEGKERSRRNGLKHGMTGAGVVLLDEDAAEIELRNDELQAEFAPKSGTGKIMVRQMATLSVRMERSAKQESAAIATKVRNAVDDFDQQRLDEADRLMDRLGEEPRVCLRKLRRSPEGVELLIEAWHDLRVSLTRSPRPLWTAYHRERAENLTGLRIDSAASSRVGALSKAIWGDFTGLGSDDAFMLDEEARQAWARTQLVERIDTEIGKLEAHYERLDFDTIDLDRAEAPTRALFDPSREATLARRYEAEATRGFFKALKELRKSEAEVAERPTPTAPPKPAPSSAALGSSCDRSAPSPRQPQPTPESDVLMDNGTNFGPIGHLDSPKTGISAIR